MRPWKKYGTASRPVRSPFVLVTTTSGCTTASVTSVARFRRSSIATGYPQPEWYDVVLLDLENLSLPGITVVGGYGHYDLGFAVPDLAYDGVRVTEEDYLRGSPSAGSPMRWRDFQLMPRGLHPHEVALEQVEGMKTRLSETGASRLIAVLHTPPFEELLGLPAVFPLITHGLRRPHRSTPSLRPISETVRWGLHCGNPGTRLLVWSVDTPIAGQGRLVWVE